ncbi:putative inorganic phosphate transporter 1-10 [Castanea sativa]|uniref:putative inorganic phosphate transporter 1-10 n=1 Tax=Castanea sativa TaxID=21020 RepID=UPI003F64F592
MVLKFLYILDTAKTQLHHFNAIIIAGSELFPDAYDLFCIPLIIILNGRLYYEKEAEPNKYVIPPVVVFTMVVIALVGTAIGQRVLGRLAQGTVAVQVHSGVRDWCGLWTTHCRLQLCGSWLTRGQMALLIPAVFSTQGFEILAALAVTKVVCAILDHAYDGASKDPTPKITDLHGR